MEPARKTVQSKDVDVKSRLSVVENNLNIVSNNVEKLETKIDSNYAVLHSRISDLRDDLRSDFENKQEKVLEKLEEHNKSSIINTESINDRISQIEKWKWMLMGASLVLGYFLAHVKLDQLF